MNSSPGFEPHLDVVVVGAGINGLFQLYTLREAGLSVRVLEAADGVGGTWYWNRYPGARLDSEAYTYAYFFSKELLDEWSWSEEFVGQPELERYFNHVADKFGLRDQIDFNTRVTSAVFDENENYWRIGTEDGRAYTARYLVAASGILSAPMIPDIPGIHDFQGELYQTALWPKEEPELTGKRVAVIGTGSSGIQVIQEVGPAAAHLTVFQRTPNWATPINNFTFSGRRVVEIREKIDEIYAATQASSGCFQDDTRPESAWDVSAEERRAYFEQLWNEPGLTMYSKNFSDLFTNKATNDSLVEFLAEKIRARVHDPEVARKLIPDHGYAMKRPPLEDGYYEVFNQDNVDLISLADEPIERFTPTGIVTGTRQLEVDVVILATGFDAITGSFTRMGIQGVGGTKLADWWSHGPRTYFGVMVHKFPNLFLLGGPQGVNGNHPRCAEGMAEWITNCVRYLKRDGYDRIEAAASAEQAWVDHINELVEGTLLRDAKSWLWGSNVPGKARAFSMYLGPQNEFRRKLADIAGNGYQGTTLSAKAAPAVDQPETVAPPAV